MFGQLVGIRYALPSEVLTTAHIESIFPEARVNSIAEKLGIRSRRVASFEECSSDLAYRAAKTLFEDHLCEPAEVDYLILVTQTPDYLLPSTSCILQHRLGLSKRTGALDIGLGCSGYVYALGVAEALITSDQAKTVLLLTADTYTKLLAPSDKGGRILFGDGASATLLRGMDRPSPSLGPFVYGTDGAGFDAIILRESACRRDRGFSQREHNGRPVLSMDGPEVFSFAMRVVPDLVNDLFVQAGVNINDVSMFVFHQANSYLINAIARRLHIPAEKLVVEMADCGNTTSSSIPIALHHAILQGRFRENSIAVLVGFGVGLSWAATLVRG